MRAALPAMERVRREQGEVGETMAVLERLLARWGTVWWRRIASRSAAAFAGKRRRCRWLRRLRGARRVSGGFWSRRRSSSCNEGVQGLRRSSGQQVAVVRLWARPRRDRHGLGHSWARAFRLLSSFTSTGAWLGRSREVRWSSRTWWARLVREGEEGCMSMCDMAGMAMHTLGFLVPLGFLWVG
jgi:hypothetical protein